MKFLRYINESKKYLVPTTKKFKFFSDNPMGEWLEHERKMAKSSKWGGSVTAGFHDLMQIPTKMVYGLKGKQGENRKLSDKDVQELMESIKKYGLHNAVFLNVEYDGKVLINEGNRRTLIAHTLGWKYIPVEIRYYAGGELIDTPFHPDKLVKVAKPWNKPTTKLPIPKRIPPKPKPIKKEKPVDMKAIKNKFSEIDPEILDLLFKK
jgi:hypothetical protein